MALINLSFRLSAREFCKEITAHTAAGIHPIMVICKMRQRIPVSIFPRSINDKKGKNIANSVIAFSVISVNLLNSNLFE
jgi:hypothetical protein